MTASVGSMVESIRFEHERVPCDFVPYEGYYDANPKPPHDRWRYSIRWVNPDGTETEVSTFKCWHPFCDESPWIRLLRTAENDEHFSVVMTAQVGPPYEAPVAVAYILRLFYPVRCEPVVVARISADPQLRHYVNKGAGVYPAVFSNVTARL